MSNFFFVNMVLDSLRRRITPTRLLYHESVEKVPFSNGGMVDLRPLRIDCGVSFAPLRHGRGLKKGESIEIDGERRGLLTGLLPSFRPSYEMRLLTRSPRPNKMYTES